MNAIKVKNLQKYYDIYKKEPGVFGSLKSFVIRKHETVKAVDDVSFEIEEGELVGFIGPNGAGKTTTLKCLSGLLYPTNGTVSVLGFKPWQRNYDFLKKITLVMGQKNQLWWDLPPIETFNLNKEIYEISDAQYKKVLGELVELLEIEDILKIQVRKLSLGQRMKCELASALLHSPKILFLDEPTIGLDIVMQKKVHEFIKEYNKRNNSTILLTSHYMNDVKELCKRVIIIDKGKLIFDGKLDQIIKEFADYKIFSLTLSKNVEKEKFEKYGEVRSLSFPKANICVKREDVAEVASRILKDLPISDLNIEEAPIEDVIRDIFTRKHV